jgi:hypothetical protein
LCLKKAKKVTSGYKRSRDKKMTGSEFISIIKMFYGESRSRIQIAKDTKIPYPTVSNLLTKFRKEPEKIAGVYLIQENKPQKLFPRRAK